MDGCRAVDSTDHDEGQKQPSQGKEAGWVIGLFIIKDKTIPGNRSRVGDGLLHDEGQPTLGTEAGWLIGRFMMMDRSNHPRGQRQGE